MSFGFGQQQQQQQPFGGFGASSSPFGSTGAFGQTPAFGASTGTTGFGASQPAFGAASTPAFGASPSFGGSTGFGAPRPAAGGFGFGSPAPSASPFGASAPAFGASSTPAFGATSTPAFGAGGFGASTPAFGVSSTPAFGATSTPAFGASSSPFGMSTPAFGAPASTPAFGGFGAAASTPAFGAAASTPAFGAGSTFGGGFGAASPGAASAQGGTRLVPYSKHQDKDQSGGTSSGGPVYYNSITAMPQYANKSVEELRWEDYQAGVKNASSAPPPPAAAPAPGGFGAPSASGAFGGFGAAPTPAFGAASTPAANPFGAPAPASPFGGFGAASTPAFGAPSSSPFGASTPAFGAASTPAFGGFGAASTPAFGAASSGGSLFGAPTSSAGGFNFGSSTPAFGAPASTPAFGAASTPAFGGFGASSLSPFGASPASSASPFGTPSPSPFGGSTPAFSAAPASSPFGFGSSAPASSASTFGFGSSFGAKPATSPGFGFASSTPAFGASTPAASTFSFSGASTGGFGTGFGAAAASAPAFSFSQPASAPAAGGGFNFGNFGSSFGAPAAGAPAAAAAQPAAPPPGVGQSPYGQLSALPAVNVPEPKVGISARPSRQAITTLRPSPLLALRSTTPRFGAGPAPRSGTPPGGAASGLGLGGGGGTGTAGSSPVSALLPARENPHRLFIREPPPSTSASPGRSSLTPSTPAAAGTAGAGVGAGAAPATAAPASAGGAGPGRASPAERYTNGGGPEPEAQQRGADASPANGSPGGAYSDLLPRLGALAGAGYTLEPSLRQLQAMAAADPESLAALEGFTLSRRNVGSLRWLVPVDVRRLELDRIARIDQGEVAVYTEGPKPAVGSKLNTRCEVTLLNVFKKKGGQVVADPASVAVFEKRLRRYCAEAGAEFVAYKPDGGVWRFRVEHFSRYGVPLDDDDDDGGGGGDDDQEHEDGDGAGPSAGQGGGGGGGVKGRRLGIGGLREAGAADADSDLDEATADEGAAGGGADDDLMAAAGAEGGGEEGELMGGGGGEEEAEVGDDEGGLAYGFYGEGAEALPLSRKRGPPGARLFPADRLGAAAWARQWGGDKGDGDGGGGGQGGGGEPLQHSLPALLALQPGQLAAMRDSFFGRGGASAPDAASAEAALAVAPPSDGVGMGGISAAAGPAARQRQGAGLRGADAPSAAHNWARPRPALLQAAADAGGGAAVVFQHQRTSTAIVVAPSSPSRLAAAATHAGPLVPSPAAAAASGAGGNVCDAFMAMGRSFRVGFGPGGQLAVPVNAASPAGAGAPAIALSRVAPIARVAAPGAAPPAVDARPGKGRRGGGPLPGEVSALRRRTLEALEAHMAMSRVVGAGEAEGDGADDEAAAMAGAGNAGLPRWRLVCSRRQLPRLVERQVAALGRRSVDARDDAAGRHAAELWELVQVLFEHIDGEDGADDDDGDDGGGDGGGGGAGDGDEAMSLGGGGGSEGSLGAALAGGDRDRSRLAAFERRAALSHWLAARSGRAVRDAVVAVRSSAGRDALPWALLHLVAGHQLGPAAALAAAAGDARLAVLLTTAGRHGATTADLARQLQVWHASGLWRDHFSHPRKLLLAVLSGRMGEAAAALGLDWPRALGLALWYATPPTEGLATALAAYEAALAGPAAVAGVAPPVPPHAADPAAALRPGTPAAASCPCPSGDAASDAQYELLLLAARGQRGAGPGFVARLLRAAGRGTNPLDAAQGWVLASTLGALGELSDTDAAGDPEPVLLRLALDTVQQLLLLASGRDAAAATCWAAYVLLHLRSELAAPDARAAAVRALLEQTAPAWAPSARARAFLTDRLGLPAEWLSNAQAVWAGYRGDTAAQLEHLLEAGQAAPAHALLCSAVAPGLFLEATRGSVARLAALCERLADAQAAIGPSWAAGGGLYHSWCRLFVAADGGGGGWRRDLVAEAVREGDDAVAATVEACCLLARHLGAAAQAFQSGAPLGGKAAGAAGLGAGGAEAAAPPASSAAAAAAARHAVMARMSSDVGGALARLGAALPPAASPAAVQQQQGCAVLGAHPPMALAGLAAQLAVL